MDSSCTEIPQRWQAADSENRTSSPDSGKTASMVPPLSPTAVDTDSSRRLRRPDFNTSRSTTASMVWRLFLFNPILSLKLTISSSTRTRTKPLRRNSCNTCSWCPFLPRTRGASNNTFSPSERLSRIFTMSSMDWDWIGSPHSGQWGRPARAKSNRRWS